MKSSFVFLATTATSVIAATVPYDCYLNYEARNAKTICKETPSKCNIQDLLIAGIDTSRCSDTPVCGSNGKTYPDSCTLELENCFLKPGITDPLTRDGYTLDPAKKVYIAYPGSCTDKPSLTGATPQPMGPTPMPTAACTADQASKVIAALKASPNLAPCSKDAGFEFLDFFAKATFLPSAEQIKAAAASKGCAALVADANGLKLDFTCQLWNNDLATLVKKDLNAWVAAKIAAVTGPTPMPSGPTQRPSTTAPNTTNSNSSSGAGVNDIKLDSGAESLTAASLALVLGVVMLAF